MSSTPSGTALRTNSDNPAISRVIPVSLANRLSWMTALLRWPSPARNGPPGTQGSDQGMTSHVILVVGLGLVVLTIAIAGFAVNGLRQHTEQSYQREIASLGGALSEQTARYINAIDLVLGDVREHVAGLDIDTPEQFRRWLDSADASAFLRAHLQNMAQINGLAAIDSTGRLMSSTYRDQPSNTDVSDRGYFRHLASHDDHRLFVSERLKGRLAGAPVVLVARRVNGPDGSFLGVVTAAIDLQHVDAFYGAIATQPGQVITLLREDGDILVRSPDPTHEAGGRMPATSPWYRLAAEGGGFYSSPGYLGGLAALVSVHPLTSYPFVVDVSVKQDVAMAAWRDSAIMLAVAGATAALGFALLSWKITALFRRQEAQNATLRQTAEALRDSEARAAQKSHLLQTTLEHMDQGILMIGRDRRVPVCNHRAMELLDLPAALMTQCPSWDDVLAHQWQANEFAGTDAEFQDFVRRSLLLDGPLVYDRERPNGRVLEVRTTPLPDGEAVRTYTDITERKQAERRIEYLAYHDGLTGLANRALLNDRLSQAVEHARRSGASFAVLALDLDRFKAINDTCGHDVGDAALRKIAERLREAVRAADTVARIGGDEFLVLQTSPTQPGSAVELARRLADTLSQPLEVAGNQVEIGTSIGVAMYPSDGGTAAALLKAADIAMYHAKTDGRGVVRLFEPEMDRLLSWRRGIERDLRAAVGTDQLTLHFQPQFSCATEVVTGFEALLRWRHPVRGDIPPSMFIPVAEESRLINDVGAWVLESACAAAASWPVPHCVAVNLSVAQFRAGDLPAKVAEVLHRTGLPAGRLELEVTESLLISHPEEALKALRAVKQMGVRISLDDFGTGYSSLSYLSRFPFDKIKIDRSFVAALGIDQSALPIVQAILAMGRSLNLEVIAEGVETQQQLRILRDQQCAEVQGFLLGRPMPLRDVCEYLDARGAVSAGEQPIEYVAPM
jgi:diguanylate cyclase (GGDEF)-like protein